MCTLYTDGHQRALGSRTSSSPIPMSERDRWQSWPSGTPAQLGRRSVQSPNSPSRVAAGSRYHRGFLTEALLIPLQLQYSRLPHSQARPGPSAQLAGGTGQTCIHVIMRSHPSTVPGPANRCWGSQQQDTEGRRPRPESDVTSLGCHILTGRVARKTWDSRLQNVRRCAELTDHSTRHRSPHSTGTL